MKTLIGAADPEDPPPLGPQVTLTTNTTNTSSAVTIWRNPMSSFVCDPCKSGDHENCPGGTHCDCQHKVQQ